MRLEFDIDPGLAIPSVTIRHTGELPSERHLRLDIRWVDRSLWIPALRLKPWWKRFAGMTIAASRE